MPADPTRRFVTTTIEIEGREETKIVEMPDRTMEPWDNGVRLDVVGKPVPRVDARDKVTGSAVYTVDQWLPGMLFAVLVRSNIPRGRAKAINLDDARRVPGFVDAIVFDDLPKEGKPIRAGGVRFLDPDISYAGQPLMSADVDFSISSISNGAAELSCRS